MHLVNLGGREEHVNAGPLRVFHGLCGLIHVSGDCPGQGGNDGSIHFFRDVRNCLKVTRRTGGKASFDNVHLHSLQLAGNLHLLVAGHADAGRLFSVAESRVQKQYSFFGHICYLIPFCY